MDCFIEKPKILIIDDDRTCMELWTQLFERSNIDVKSAFSIEEARRFESQLGNFALIAMDACVPGNRPTTYDLLRDFRAKYNGIIVSISSDEEYRQQMMKLGCNAESDKMRLVGKVVSQLDRILGSGN